MAYGRIGLATTLVHELAHQWFGDAVTLRQWPDIWLHEGFAE
jgi:aminopeptidase N